MGVMPPCFLPYATPRFTLIRENQDKIEKHILGCCVVVWVYIEFCRLTTYKMDNSWPQMNDDQTNNKKQWTTTVTIKKILLSSKKGEHIFLLSSQDQISEG